MNQYEYAGPESESYQELPPESAEYDREYTTEREPWERLDEARRQPPPVRTAPRQSAYTPRTTGTTNPVSQAQLAAFGARVTQQIGVNSTAIRTLDGRVRGVISDQGKQGAALRKEIMDRKKATDKLTGDLKSTRELGAIVGLISASGGTSTIARLAPLIFLVPPETFSGYSPGSPSPGGVLGGENNLVALIAVAAAAGLFK